MSCMQLSTAASISSNIDGVIVCPGEELILTCTGQGTSQRWRVTANGASQTDSISFLFVQSDELGTQEHQGYSFTLISTMYDNFISTLSSVVTSTMNNTVAECTGHLSKDSVSILLAGYSNCGNVASYHNHSS